MRELIVSAALLGLAVACTSPASVLAVIVMLQAPAGVQRALGFMAGWAAAIGAIAFVLAVFPSADFHSSHTTPSRAASILELLLGVALVVTAWMVWRRPPARAPRDPIPPRLTTAIYRHPSLSFAAGALMLTYSITIVAALEILKADVGPAQRVVAMIVYALASMVTIGAPVAITIVRPDRSTVALAAGRAWIGRHSRTVTVVMLALIGAGIAAKALFDLLAG
jgi:Sap, sulfolipid-1-addressing protein